MDSGFMALSLYSKISAFSAVKKFLKVIADDLLQLFPKIRVRDGRQNFRPFPQRLTAEVGNSILGNHKLD
jgi:hypothetical protein